MKKKVYLSGGLVTDWQNEVMSKVDADFYNPAEFELGGKPRVGPEVYAPLDRIKIEECHIVFGYLEASNPTPINVMVECGYGKGLGKIVILCNEWTEDNTKNGTLKATSYKDRSGRVWFKPHYLDLVRNWFDFVIADFGHAIDLLKELVE